MGSATTYHLAARGARVLGLDQYEPPHDMGSSHGESRLIRLIYYEHPLYVPLVRRSYDLWRRLEHDAKAPGLLRITGGLMVGRPESALIAGAVKCVQQHGMACEQIKSHELQERFPQFMPLQGYANLYDPEAGLLDPERCIAAHLTLARKHMADVRTNEQVLNWTPIADGVRVRTTKGTYEAGKLVLCAGPWIGELLGAMGPTFAVERQVLSWFEPPGDRAMWAPGKFPVFMCEFEDGQVVYGCPLGERGWKAAVHYEGEPVTDVRNVRRRVEPHDIAKIRGALSRLFPWVHDAKLLDSAVCMYTDTQDLRFVIDFLPALPQVLVSSPCSGHGFKFSSAIGELQAQLVLDGKCDFDLEPFRIDR